MSLRILVAGVFWFSTAAAQSFEVASVKPSPPDVPGTFLRYLPDGGLRATGVTLKFLISAAYGVRAFQISGGPAWIDTVQFEVEARGGQPDAQPTTDIAKLREAQRRANECLKTLLADRFLLSLHPETREQAVYHLVVAKSGPKMQDGGEGLGSIRRIGKGSIKGQSTGLDMLTLNLSSELGRRVIDKTDLKGRYTFELTWTADTEGPTIFTALQEQLGLRLEAAKGPVEMLIVDRAGKPSGN